VIAATSFPAIGTTAVVAVTDAGALDSARGLLQEELDRLDRICSRFRDDSELSAANRAAGRPVEISGELRAAIRSALAAARATNGLVDPTVGADLETLGYDRTFELVKARDGWTFTRPAPRQSGWRRVELDDQGSCLRVPAGVTLDLGATAKAEAADRAAQTLTRALDCGVVVSLGGDVAVAGHAPLGGWCVAISDDHAAAETNAKVLLTAGGLATSSTTVRRWPTQKGEMHHVVDPRTGRSAATRWRTVSVAAPTCLDANVASTASLVLGDEAPGWLAARGLPARLVANDCSVTTIAGWPGDA
jgi:FAD:protein FMN transferase